MSVSFSDFKKPVYFFFFLTLLKFSDEIAPQLTLILNSKKKKKINKNLIQLQSIKTQYNLKLLIFINFVSNLNR